MEPEVISMLAIPIPPPDVTSSGGGADPVVGWVMLGFVVVATMVAYVVSNRTRELRIHPTGVTRLAAAH